MSSNTLATWRHVAGQLLRWVVIPLLALRVLSVIAFRTHYRPVIDAVRGFNKHILNPAMLRLAGHRGWYAARVEHVGRRSGHRYATPVWAEPTPGGFIVPLPYGRDVDWCRNLQAAGGGVVEDEGMRYPVGAPVIVPAAEAQLLLPPRVARLFGRYGVEHYLKLAILPGTPPRQATSGVEEDSPIAVVGVAPPPAGLIANRAEAPAPV